MGFTENEFYLSIYYLYANETGDPFDPFALQKACLLACEIIPKEGSSLEEILDRLGGGFEMHSEVTNVPKGSGLGTSSILSAACVKAVFRQPFGLPLGTEQKSRCRKQQHTDRADLQQHRRTDRRKTRLRRRRRWLPSGHSEKRRNPTAGRRTPERGVHGQPGWSSGLQACVGMRF